MELSPSLQATANTSPAAVIGRHLKVWPVGGHPRPVRVPPPAKVLLLVDGRHRLAQFLVHGANAVVVSTTNHNGGAVRGLILAPPAGGQWHSPLVASDVQVCVDGQEGLLEEGDAATLLVL